MKYFDGYFFEHHNNVTYGIDFKDFVVMLQQSTLIIKI